MKSLILFVVVVLVVIGYVAIRYGIDMVTNPLSIFFQELTK